MGKTNIQTENDVSASQLNQVRSPQSRCNDPSDEPKVSILIITFNQKDYVAETIESAIKQDYENLEVVISDDGSTDGTAEIIAQWQSRYPERLVALLNRDNVGITRNSNRALRACSGDFIAFQGGDDVLLPGKITAQVNWFKQDRRRVLCGHQVEVFYDDRSRPSHLGKVALREGNGPEDLIRRGVPFGATSIMVRASDMPAHGFDEAVPIASDLLFWIEVLTLGGDYGYVDGVYAKARRHNANVTDTKVFEILNDVERTYLLVANRYPQYREICTDSIIKHVVYYGGVRMLNIGNKRAARERFIAAIRKKPLFLKAWVRLLQTL